MAVHCGNLTQTRASGAISTTANSPSCFCSTYPVTTRVGLYELNMSDEWRLSIIQDGELTPINVSDGSDNDEFWLYRGSGGENVVVSVQDAIQSGSQLQAPSLLNWRTCAESGDCDLTTINGDARWSPSAEHAIVVATDPDRVGFFQTNLIDSDGNILEVIVTNTIRLSFWLDNETFAFVQSIRPGWHTR